MENNKIGVIEPPSNGVMEPPKRKRKRYKTRVYFSTTEEAQRFADMAVKHGFRRGGLPIMKKRKHGFIGDSDINSDGIGPFMKWAAEQIDAIDKLKEGLKELVK